jgi:hypothetical protein
VTLAELLANATPGPWWIDHDGFGEATWVHARGDVEVSLVQGGEVGDADARLIALAPDLARLALDMGEALQRLVAMEESYTGETSPDHALLARLDGIANKDAA